jgi:hypothetical protein
MFLCEQVIFYNSWRPRTRQKILSGEFAPRTRALLAEPAVSPIDVQKREPAKLTFSRVQHRHILVGKTILATKVNHRFKFDLTVSFDFSVPPPLPGKIVITAKRAGLPLCIATVLKG